MQKIESAVKETLRLTAYSKWDDARLMEGSSQDFVKKLYHRGKSVGDDLYDCKAYEITPLEPEAYRESVIYYMRRRAWSEWYFGTVSPARQISLLPNERVDLKLRIARQIRDEVRHYDVFVRELKRYGAEARIDEFKLPDVLVQMQRVQMAMETASEIAATNQFAGEIVLTSITDGNSILVKLLDAQLMDAIRDMETDEPPHVAIGRDLVLLYSETAAQRRRLAGAQEQYLEAMMQMHVLEIAKLGCRRVKPVPVFE
jgi:hypothetical protein